MSIGASSWGTNTVVVVVELDVTSGSPPVKMLKKSAMRMTPRRRPEMARAARTPAVA
jgi:hypothetical protein